ncbi:hypothetical protein PAMC26510_34305 [Caballeronia sordidicola]|uniref:Uncharacterized protein n=1 Tax=Caballeronia sordidicola TaxID=196367 RepID=A0A242M8H1_CABSO|nr:hypothetical protein PAMC26510_34305 [Caballeronia sordidicola]OTP71687.1 hypothetical protein PAMC26577_22280 [Caballeronia sordidicola]
MEQAGLQHFENRNVATLQRGMACGQPAASTGEIVSLQQSIAVIVKHKLTTLIVVQR